MEAYDFKDDRADFFFSELKGWWFKSVDEWMLGGGPRGRLASIGGQALSVYPLEGS